MEESPQWEYIEMDKEGYITLLDKGAEIAEKISMNVTFLTDWLTSIGVDPQLLLLRDACRIEHVISAETFTAMKDIEDEIELTVTHCILFERKNSRCDIVREFYYYHKLITCAH